MKVAPVGHTFWQGGSWQCMHGMGRNFILALGYFPASYFMTLWKCTPAGVPCSARQATVQELHPVHF
jgi:hypothetical protein